MVPAKAAQQLPSQINKLANINKGGITQLKQGKTKVSLFLHKALRLISLQKYKLKPHICWTKKDKTFVLLLSSPNLYSC